MQEKRSSLDQETYKVFRKAPIVNVCIKKYPMEVDISDEDNLRIKLLKATDINNRNELARIFDRTMRLRFHNKHHLNDNKAMNKLMTNINILLEEAEKVGIGRVDFSIYYTQYWIAYEAKIKQRLKIDRNLNL